jgi:hypothetical protein
MGGSNVRVRSVIIVGEPKLYKEDKYKIPCWYDYNNYYADFYIDQEPPEIKYTATYRIAYKKKNNKRWIISMREYN